MTMRPAEAGFTLIEILVVVAIMAATVAIAAPLLRGPPLAAQLQADATRFAAALKVTRAAAMSQNRELTLTLDTERRRYGSPAVTSARIDPRIDLVRDGSTPAGERDSFAFFPSGRSTGGSILFRAGRLQARISVIWATGDVVVAP